jgi:hypothetical protein
MAKNKVLDYLSGATGIGTKVTKTAEVGNILSGQALIQGVASVTADAAIGTGKVLNKAMPLTKKTDANIGNLWTGRREARGAIAAGAVIGTGYMGYSTMKQTALAPRVGEVSYSGTAPVMDADGVGSRSQAPTLGAGGNMVFGLHSARKG